VAKAKKTAKDDGQTLSTPDRRPSSQRTTGLWSRPLLAIGTSLAGLLAAALLLWWQLISPGNENHAESLRTTQADMYAAYFNARYKALREVIDRAATAPETVSALGTFDPLLIAAQGRDLTTLVPNATRVDIILKGKAEVDLSAATPISFAALDVIKRAETSPFVGPEASQANQQPVFYVAQPVTDQGVVAGVLFAAISMDYFYQPLKSFPNDLGLVTVEQQFESTSPRVVMQFGADSTKAPVQRKLEAPNWSLMFRPSAESAAPILDPLALTAPLAVAIALMLAGVYFSYSWLFRALESDAATLTDYVTRLVRGRGGNLDRYQLPLFQQIAIAANRFARSAGEGGDDEEIAPKKAKKTAAAEPAEENADTDSNDDDFSADDFSADDFAEDAPPEDIAPADFLEVTDNRDNNFGIEVTEDVSPVEAGLELDPQIFRAYDIRGIVTTNLTEDVVYWIGRAFGAEAIGLQQSKVTVGCDGRLSSPALKTALAKGLTESGLDVMDVGEVPTPLLYYSTYALDTGTGIMITGSHNPPDYNGLKMVLAGETLAEERIARLHERIVKNEFVEGEGDLESFDVEDHYIDRICNDIAIAQSMKVVVDCGNGVAGRIAPRLISELGCEVVPLYCEIDGNFPNHHPDPADPANLQDLITVVKAENADLGIAFDGDGDRLGVVTSKGEIIWPDKLLMLFARDIVGRNPGADVIFDVKCSRHLNSVIAEYGGRPIMWKTGHSHMKAKLRETGALLAGEFSGHICFGERWYGFDDALYSAARLLEIVGGESRSAEELFAEFPVTFSTPEIKVESTEDTKFGVVERLAAEADFGDGTVSNIDGIRVDYPDGWGLVRPSNTSPVLTLRFEADGQSALDRIQALFKKALLTVDSTLKFPNP
jgi:phosphomannomutase/phosphoglucomutase